MSNKAFLCWVFLSVVVLGLKSEVGLGQETSFKISYAQAFNLNSTLKVKLDFGTGTQTTFAVDTGSVGIVVPKSELPSSTKEAVDGSIRYTSSGLVVDGFWTEPIDIKLGNSGAVAHVPVFAATDSHCVQPASNACRAGSLPHMMGIGFGRPDSYASPDRNPLIHIRNLPAGRPSNYRITHAGIELGILHAAAIPGLHTIHLAAWTRPGMSNEIVTDYKTPTGSIRLNGGDLQQASILIDTGITDALIALASGEPPGCSTLPRKAGVDCVVATKTQFALSMVNDSEQLSFAIGDGEAATPSSAHWIHLNPKEGTFINTGIRPLAVFDVYYDYTTGVFGLSPASQ